MKVGKNREERREEMMVWKRINSGRNSKNFAAMQGVVWGMKQRGEEKWRCGSGDQCTKGVIDDPKDGLKRGPRRG